MYITTGDCVACGACVCACPKDSIVLKKDDNGFYMPTIDKTTCIDCGKCRRVCPVNNRPQGKSWEAGNYYALWDTDPAGRKAGSSGGAFGLLAEAILAQGGVVFGAAYASDCKSVHQIGTDTVALEALKKSKYVESYTGTVFADVKAALESGRKVLYCGTSCQIDGLKSFLNREYEGLLTCDFLCHGVPAAGVYEKYICELEERYGKVESVDFRSKSYGWKAYCSKVTFASGKVYLKTLFQDPYLRIFFENYALREACYHCERLQESNADLTLGDYWRVSESADIPDTNEGISLVGVHTPAGAEALAALTCFVKELPRERYSYAYTRKSHKPKDREAGLRTILANKRLFNQPVSLKTVLKGHLYHLRAIQQKLTMKKP